MNKMEKKLEKVPQGNAMRQLDVVCLMILIIWLSHAWYYPSLNTTEKPPGTQVFSAIANISMLYMVIRLFLTGRFGAVYQNLAFSIFLLYACSSIFSSYSIYNTIGMIRAELLFFGACLFLSVRFAPSTLLLIMADAFGMMMILSVILATMTNIGVMEGFDAGRWRGVFGHKNSLGEYASITLIIIIGIWQFRMGAKFRHAPYVVAAFICLIMADSANSVSSFGAALLLFILTRYFTWLPWPMALKVPIYVGVIALLPILAYSSLAVGADLLHRDLTFTGRTGIWDWFLFYADQRPWTGWGWATIGANQGMLGYIRQTLNLPDIQTPHSGYVSIAVELGYPALVLYTFWILTTLVKFVRRSLVHKDCVAIVGLAILGGLVVHNFFESTAAIIPSIWMLILIAFTGTLSKKATATMPISKHQIAALNSDNRSCT